MYMNFDGDFDEHDLAPDADIIEVQFHSNGFVARQSNDKFQCVDDYARPVSTVLSDLYSEKSALRKQIHGWAVLPPKVNRGLEILVSTDVSAVFLTTDGIRDTNYVGNGPYELISLPQNNELVALYSEKAREVTIATLDFRRVLNLYQSDNTTKPLQLAWCGNDAVIISYKDEMKLVGPSKDSLNFYLDSKTIIRSEADGLFYLSKEKLGFLSRVGSVTQDTFKIGSTAPSAILLDAIDLLDKHSPKANENIEIINDKLVEAVDGCIRAAAEEFEPYWQKKLLRAAAFGKVTIELYNSEEFVETCNILRVLNIVRQPEIGMFLTYSQFVSLGAEGLLRLLLLRKLHFLCLKLAEFLDLPKDDLFLDWASCKIKSSVNMTDDELASLLIKRLSPTPVSFASIAEVAYQEGRRPLTVKLLNQETETARSIPLLLEMEQDDYALLKAEEDMDVDSLLYVLLILYNKLSLADFFKILDAKPNSVGVFKANMTGLDAHLLYDFYYQDDFISGLASEDIENFFRKDEEGGTTLDSKRTDLLKAARLLSRSKYTALDGKRLRDEVKVVELQDKLYNDEIVPHDKYEPVMKTLERLTTVDLRKAIKMQKDFKIPDRQFYYMVLKTLAKIPERRHELYEFATSKKSPIGYEPFYLELLKVGDKRQASMYVKLCTNLSYKARVRCYLECNDFKEAVQEASRRKDSELLEGMRTLTTNQAYIRMIDDSLENVTGARR
ncbi:DEKNAAC103559 [Brettanomyces naardenensis]|uniref:DEKNAAC103559 n=1 Tax=Brettanomyces naardenensis TaxID=13370 RepID=A0A448YNF6_BRENA|nr:DEKNAAC103559 [Brettanomyces naardenensis]